LYRYALAVLDWAVANGASVYCHWFQPMAASGVRHGLSAGVMQTMYEFDKEGTPVFVVEVRGGAVPGCTSYYESSCDP
jgi:hypothetical protein